MCNLKIPVQLKFQLFFQSSNVNLPARDYLLDMVAEIGGNKVTYPTAGNSPFPEPADLTK